MSLSKYKISVLVQENQELMDTGSEFYEEMFSELLWLKCTLTFSTFISSIILFVFYELSLLSIKTSWGIKLLAELGTLIIIIIYFITA